jgi:hypothetical protein
LKEGRCGSSDVNEHIAAYKALLVIMQARVKSNKGLVGVSDVNENIPPNKALIE